MKGPTNLAGGSYYDSLAASRVHAPGPVRPQPPLPPPAGPALLSINRDSRAEFSKSLLREAKLRGGQYVQIVVPKPNMKHPRWYLETKPKPGAGVQLPVSDRVRVRLLPVPRFHFLRPKPTLKDLGSMPPIEGHGGGGRGLAAVANVNEELRILHFVLGPEVPGHAGYYELLPYRAGPGPE